MLTKLFRKREEQSRLDGRVVWGIWCQRRLRAVYKMAAAELRVPISVLVGHVLMQWVAQDYETIFSDEQKLREFGDYLARVHGVSPHCLRDAFAVHAVKLDDSGDGLRLQQEHLGHASLNTTARYRKVAGE